MQLLKKVIAIFVGVMFGLSLTGAIYQLTQSRVDQTKFPSPGRLYDDDGLSIHMDCRGKGSPTILMEAGLTSGSSSWSLVHDAIATTTRVCAYDRPGMDWSEPIGRVADAKEVSDRFHRLVDQSDIEGPKILLGMSAGGVYVREYYRNHPEEIVGMILVDSSHEQQQNRLPEFVGSEIFDTMLNACRLLQPIGIIRFFGLLDQFLDSYNLDDNTREKLLANMNQSHTCSSMYWESQSFANEIKDTNGPALLDDLPLLVLSQGDEPAANPDLDVSLEFAIAQRKVWNELQLELTNLSTRGRRYIAENSGHVIQLNQPELMIEKVTEFVLELKSSHETSNP